MSPHIFEKLISMHRARSFVKSSIPLKPPKNRLPSGIFEFRKKVLVQKDVDYTIQQKTENGQYKHPFTVLTTVPCLKSSS